MIDHAAIRILDASLNRAGEGLRVVEDYARFVLDDAHLTAQFKQLRHDLAAAGAALPLPERHASRETQRDVGTAISTPAESRRDDAWSVCIASLERVKQSLRSLEEYGKVAQPQVSTGDSLGPAAVGFEALRYRLYTLEAAMGRTVDAVERLAGVRLYVLIDGCDSEAAFVDSVEQLVAARVDAIQLREKRLSDRELIERGRLLRKILSEPHNTPITSGSLPLEGRDQTSTGDPKSPERSAVARREATGEGVRGGYTLQSPLPNPPHQGEGTRGATQREPKPLNKNPLFIINDRADVAAAADADGVHLGQDDLGLKEARAILGPRKLIGVSTHSIEQARAAVLDGANYIGVGPTFPSTTKTFAQFPGVELLRRVAAEIRLPAFAIGGVTAENLNKVLATGFSRIAVSSAVTAAPSPAATAAALRAILYASPIK